MCKKQNARVRTPPPHLSKFLKKLNYRKTQPIDSTKYALKTRNISQFTKYFTQYLQNHVSSANKNLILHYKNEEIQYTSSYLYHS